MDKMTTKDEIGHGTPSGGGWDNFQLLHEEVVATGDAGV